MIPDSHPLKLQGFPDDAITELDALYDSKPPVITREQFYLGVIAHQSGQFKPTPGYVPPSNTGEFIEFEETK